MIKILAFHASKPTLLFHWLHYCMMAKLEEQTKGSQMPGEQQFMHTDIKWQITQYACFILLFFMPSQPSMHGNTYEHVHLGF